MSGQWYAHYSHVPMWLWELTPNFHPEIDKRLYSPDTGEIYFDIECFQALQRLRDAMGPIHIISGYRSKVHNARVGGEPRSQHTERIAFDIPIGQRDVHELVVQALGAGFTGIGLYPSRGFVHVDMGKPRTWYGSKKDKEIMAQAPHTMV